MNHTWYRNMVWDEQIEAEFFTRLRRARSQNPQYVVIQAITLADADQPELARVALNLIELFVQQYYDRGLASNAFNAKAQALLMLDRFEDACQAFEDALEARRALPSVVNDAWLQYPLLIARQRARERYPRAMEVLEEFLPGAGLFPLDKFLYFAAVALISAESGDDASRWAVNALEAAAAPAPFPRHPTVGLVGARYSALQIELKRLASG
jgi:tetratricopeptide (TPR) repeat protein